MSETDELAQAPPAPDTEPETEPEPQSDEPENQSEEAEPPTEPEPEPEPVGEQEVERQAKALSTAAKNYSKRVVEILGAELGDGGGWLPCELCGQPFPGIRLNRKPDDETVERLRVLIGLPSMENYASDRYSRECDACAGLGIVKTGSKVAQHATVQCLVCKGKGWVAIGDERAGAVVVVPEGAQPVLTADDQAAPPAMPPAALDAFRKIIADAEMAQAAG